MTRRIMVPLLRMKEPFLWYRAGRPRQVKELPRVPRRLQRIILPVLTTGRQRHHQLLPLIDGPGHLGLVPGRFLHPRLAPGWEWNEYSILSTISVDFNQGLLLNFPEIASFQREVAKQGAG